MSKYQPYFICECQVVGEPLAVVLAEWAGDYVTWEKNLLTGELIQGHYFNKGIDGAILAAVGDYCERYLKLNRSLEPVFDKLINTPALVLI